MKSLLSSLVVLLLLFAGCSSKQDSDITKIDNKNNEEKVSNSDSDFISELALHDAIRAKDIEIVKDLISHGVEIDKKDLYGYTPLHLAVRFGLYDIVDLLISKGANVNNVDDYEDTPLLDSTRNSTNDISRLLLCNGANSNVMDKHDMKPIHNASKNNDLYIVEMIQNKSIINMCEKLDITLDSYSQKDNKICGKIEKGIAKNIKVTITDENSESLKPHEEVEAQIILDTYCAQLSREISENNPYIVTVVGTNLIDKDIESSSLEKIKIKEVKQEPFIAGLYEDLVKEFQNDFDTWNAELDKQGLVFRFKKQEVLFANGSSEVKQAFKDILDKFFPRYIKVIEKYKDEILDIRVEGHTSSSYGVIKDEQIKYNKNKELSENRAKKVYDYTVNNIVNSEVEIDKEWLNKTYSYHGMSYDDLILNELGEEDEVQSRRVEFRINKKIN